MIETVRKRFDGKPEDDVKNNKVVRRQSIIEELADGLDENEISGPKTPAVEKTEKDSISMSSAVPDSSTQVKKRRKDP